MARHCPAVAGHAHSSAYGLEMSTTPSLPLPLDPDSPRGREAAAALTEIFADVEDRLRAESKPVPAEQPE